MIRPRKLLLGLLLFAGCRGVLGIEEPVEIEQQSCLRNSDCADNDVCLFRVCGDACAEDGDCPDGKRCLRAPDGNACVSNAVASCSDEECPSDLLCVAGSCRSACARDADCLPDQVCSGGACRGTDRARDPAAPAGGAGGGGRTSTAGGGKASSSAGEGGEIASAGASQGGASTGGRESEGGRPVAPPLEGGSAGAAGAPATAQGGDGPGGCEEGERRCSGKRLEECEGGEWVDRVACPFVCSDEMLACDGVCVPGTPRCNQNVPELCSEAGQWVAGEPCDSICSGGTCTGSCEPGTRDCNLLTAQECTSDGTWSTIDTCDYVCDRGECSGECEPGTYQCLADNRTREQCGADGEWGSAATCQYACVEGDCTGSCIPGSSSCTDDSLYSCTNQGVPELEEECEFVCRSNRCTGSCVPGRRYCSGNAWYECSANGEPSASTNCGSNQLCRSGNCEANDPYTVGYSTRLANAQLSAGNVMYLTRVTLPRRASLRKFGMHGESGEVRFALYDASVSGQPRNRVALSETATIKSSMAGMATEANPVTTVALNPGNYWVAGIYNGVSASDYVGSASGQTTYYIDPQSFGSAPPASIPGSGVGSVSNSVMNYYLVVQDLPEE